ncbi:TM2 domain-containing protein [Desulfuromusa kysingii]|uniref:TM2 domain-containing protein n=1 Tax=Desulfuromusa kysingii TaxID=37625 RepID=A0A1H4BMI7_9BACT|nr:NINE protein [Desulfuromusa kysingii]SEA49297.1 TM2 domain-containing protein [Desulfuromusa kysingii]
MFQCHINCPHCGFSQDVHQDPAILHGKTVTCPKCRKTFPFVQSDLDSPSPSTPPARQQQLPRTSNSSPIKPRASKDSSPRKFCTSCGNQINVKAEICPKCFVRVTPPRNAINKAALLLITFFLGGIGGHKFYVKKYLQGVLYLLFCWTYIPSLFALIEFFIYAFKSEEKLQEKFPETSSGALLFLLIIPVVIVIVGILAAIAIPQFTAYQQKANDTIARSALTTCQTQIEIYFVDHGTYPLDTSQLQCQTPDDVSLFYLVYGSEGYQLISLSDSGSKAFLSNQNQTEVDEFEKSIIEEELAARVGEEVLTPGFHFVE